MGLVHGGIERDSVISQFKKGKLKCIINVNILTTGFNVPDIDMIAICRATQSVSLYVQIVGRGTRIAKGKTDCLVLDFGGNVERHGAIDTASCRPKGQGIAPMKDCPECGRLYGMMQKECECGHKFEIAPRVVGKKLEEKAAKGGLTSTEPMQHDIDFVEYHAKTSSTGNNAIVVEFWQFDKQYPVATMWLTLWHKNDFWRKKCWQKLNALCGGIIKKEFEIDHYQLAQELNEFYSEGSIPKVNFISTLPQKDNPKYKEVIGFG